MNKKNLLIHLLLILSSFASAQRDYSKIPFALVTTNNDTIICTNARKTIAPGVMKCDGKKIDIKTMIYFGTIWDVTPRDIDKPNEKQEMRLARVPKLLYSDTAKVAVVISFYDPKTTYEGVQASGNISSLSPNEKPACFEFIKKQIEHDLNSLKIKPVIFLNDYTINIEITNTTIKKINANAIILFRFHKNPKNKHAENGEVSIDDFSEGVISIIMDYSGYDGRFYATEDLSLTATHDRFNYKKTWRKFLIDYENSKPK